jgi:hypothetical protein
MQEWLEWLLEADPLGIASAVHNSSSSSSASQLLGRRSQITVENVISGSVPWRRSVVGSDEAAQVAAHKVWVKGLELERTLEELQLIQRDREALLVTLSQQIAVLQRAIESDDEPDCHKYIYTQELLRVQGINAAAAHCFERLALGDAAAAASALADVIGDHFDADDDP